MPNSIKKVTLLKQRYERDWMAIPGVTAVGIGQVEQRQIGIIISVSIVTDSIRKQIPKQVDGVIVKIQVSGILRTT